MVCAIIVLFPSKGNLYTKQCNNILDNNGFATQRFEFSHGCSNMVCSLWIGSVSQMSECNVTRQCSLLLSYYPVTEPQSHWPQSHPTIMKFNLTVNQGCTKFRVELKMMWKCKENYIHYVQIQIFRHIHINCIFNILCELHLLNNKCLS